MAAASSIVQATSSAAGAYSQSESIKAEGAYKKQVADANSTISKFKAKDALDRGNTASLEQMHKTDLMASEQRAAQSANGTDINSGSAQAVRSSSRVVNELDAQTIKNNAWRESWGYEVQASNQKNEGEFAQIAANNESNNTLITGGLRAISYGAQAVDKWPRKKAGG